MWNLLILIRLILKSKIQLKRLKKTDLIIFDEQSVFDLRNIIPNFNYFVLQTRSTNINKIYFNLEIFFKLIKNYNGNIFTAYLTYACIKIHFK